VPAFERFYREVERTYPNANDKLKFNEALKGLLNRLVGDLIGTTQNRLQASGIQTLDDLRRHPLRLASFSPAVDKDREQAKAFLHDRVYFSPTLEPEKDAAERIIRELFTFWMEYPNTLPESYQEKAREESLPRVICDYVAGMTDNFIIEQYEKHLGERQ